MLYTKDLRIMRLESRLNKLKTNPVENQRIISKAMRQLRNLKK